MTKLVSNLPNENNILLVDITTLDLILTKEHQTVKVPFCTAQELYNEGERLRAAGLPE